MNTKTKPRLLMMTPAVLVAAIIFACTGSMRAQTLVLGASYGTTAMENSSGLSTVGGLTLSLGGFRRRRRDGGRHERQPVDCRKRRGRYLLVDHGFTGSGTLTKTGTGKSPQVSIDKRHSYLKSSVQ